MPTHLAEVPSVCLHRADLQQALFSALSPDSVHLGEQLVHYLGSGKTAMKGYLKFVGYDPHTISLNAG